MKTGIFLLLAQLALGGVLAAEGVELVGTIYEPIKPRFLAVDDQQLYLAESATVHIYSLKNFKKITQFGKAGEGPEEFVAAAGGMTLVLLDTQLMVSSINKINFYEKNGSYLKTMKIQGGLFGGNFFPVKEGFIGMGNMDDKNGMTMAISLYDEQLNKKNEIRKVTMNVMSGKFNVFDLTRRMIYEVNQERVFFLSDDDQAVTISSVDGNSLSRIELGLGKVPLTKDDINRFLNQIGRNAPEAQKEEMKKRLEFPDFYPPMIRMIAKKNHLFVLSWKKEKDQHLAALYDINSGKKLTEAFVPLQFSDGIIPLPFAYHNGYYYAVNELPDEDEPDELIYKVVRKKLL